MILIHIGGLITLEGYPWHAIADGDRWSQTCQAVHRSMHLALSRNRMYPLVNVYKKKWKDPLSFMGKLTISMTILHSYVKLPAGTLMAIYGWRKFINH